MNKYMCSVAIEVTFYRDIEVIAEDEKQAADIAIAQAEQDTYALDEENLDAEFKCFDIDYKGQSHLENMNDDAECVNNATRLKGLNS